MAQKPSPEMSSTPVDDGLTPVSPTWLTAGRERAAAAALLAVLATLLVATAWVSSATPDEIGAHIPGGYLYWTGGRVTDGIDNLPLGQLVVAAPLALGGLDWELFSDQHLLLCRLPVIGLMLLAAAVMWRLVRRLAGPVPALATLALLATSPNLIAHGSLANLDGQITAWFVLAMAAAERFATRPTWWRLALLGGAVGAALATKGQALLLGGLVAVVLLVWRPAPGSPRRRIWLAAWALLPVACVATACLVSRYLPGLDGGLLPPRFAENLLAQLSHSRGAHHAYLLGAYSKDGWWYYFPVALATKTPLPTLALLVAGLLRRPSRRELVLLWLPPALLLAAAMASGLNIGLRHVLPAYPFLLAVAGIGAARLAAHRSGRWAAAALLVAAGATAAATHPHHLAFFNRLAGGRSNGYRILLDSNFDWAQNDRFLAAHVAASGLDYQIDPDPLRPTTGAILVNANARYGISTIGGAAYRWLEPYRPVAQIADTWFEYRVPGPPPPPDPRRQRQQAVERYLLALRRDNADLDQPAWRFALARMLAEVGSYQAAMTEVRGLLTAQPTLEPPLWLGSELVLGRAMGALAFTGDEYLTGFRTPPIGEPPTASELAPVVRGTPLGGELATALSMVGVARYERGDAAAARAAFEAAVALDPTAAGAAADNLRRMTAAGL